MKKLWCCLTFMAVLAFPILAEQVQSNASSPAPEMGFSMKHDLSPPLREMALSVKPDPAAPAREIPHVSPQKGPAAPAPLAMDPLLGPVPGGGAPMPAPIISFDGPDDDDNQLITGNRYAPSDSQGDVGPNHYVQDRKSVV